jgi:WD40 repeat protein
LRSASRASLPVWRSVRSFLILKQVRHHLDDPKIRHAACASVEHAVGTETTVIIAHSLGSVVAYEALCSHLDGRPALAASGTDGAIRVWYLDALNPVRAPIRWRVKEVTSLGLGSFDGRHILIAGSASGLIQAWDIGSRLPLHKPFKVHLGLVTSLAFHVFSDRPAIVSGGRDGVIRVTDLNSGSPLFDEFRAHGGWSPNSVATGIFLGQTVIISGGADAAVTVGDVNGKALRRIGIGTAHYLWKTGWPNWRSQRATSWRFTAS